MKNASPRARSSPGNSSDSLAPDRAPQAYLEDDAENRGGDDAKGDRDHERQSYGVADKEHVYAPNVRNSPCAKLTNWMTAKISVSPTAPRAK